MELKSDRPRRRSPKIPKDNSAIQHIKDSTGVNVTELSLTQQFNVRAFETQVEKMSLEQAQHFLKELYKQMMVRDAMYQELLRKEWDIR